MKTFYSRHGDNFKVENLALNFAAFPYRCELLLFRESRRSASVQEHRLSVRIQEIGL